MSHAELAALAPGLPPETAAGLLKELTAAGTVVEGEGGYAAGNGAGVLSSEQEAVARQVLQQVAESGLAPPTLATLEEELHVDQRQLTKLLEVLTRRGELVRAKEDLWFARRAVAAARERLKEALARSGRITLGEFRDLAGTGRRNAQALLELFDREGLTRRQGDARIPRRRSP